MRNTMTITISPAATTAAVDCIPLSYWGRGYRPLRGTCVRRVGQFFPTADIGDSLFVPGDDHLDALVDEFARFAADIGDLTGAIADEDHLAGAAAADTAGDGAEHADHVVIGRIQ